MIVKTLGYRSVHLVDGDAPIGHPRPLWLQTLEAECKCVIGHAVIDPFDGEWEVKVDAWRFGVAPTTPSRYLHTLCRVADRSAAAFALIGAAWALAQPG